MPKCDCLLRYRDFFFADLEQEVASFKDSSTVNESDSSEKQVVKVGQSVTDLETAEQTASKNEENNICKAENVATGGTDEGNSDVEPVETAVTLTTKRGRKRKATSLKTPEDSQTNDEKTKQQKVDTSLDDIQEELKLDVKTTTKRGRRGRKPRGGKVISTRKETALESPSSEATMSTNDTSQDESMIEKGSGLSTETYDSADDSGSRQGAQFQKSLIDNEKNLTIAKEEQHLQEMETTTDKVAELDEEPVQPMKRKPRGRSRKSSDKDTGISAQKSHLEDKMEQASIVQTEVPDEEVNVAQQIGEETEGIDPSKEQPKADGSRKRRGKKGKTDDLESKTSQETSNEDTTEKRRGRSQKASVEKPSEETQQTEEETETIEQSNETVSTVKRRGRSAAKGNNNKPSVTTDEHLSEGEPETTERSSETLGTATKRRGRQKKVLTSPTSDEDKTITTTDEEEIAGQMSRSTRGTVKNQTKLPTGVKRPTRGRTLSGVENDEEPITHGEESSDSNVKRTRRSVSNPSDDSSVADAELSSGTESNKTPKAATRGRSLRKRN